MSWNNKTETEKMKKEQAQNKTVYLASHMPEESIQAIEKYDMQQFRNQRNLNEHLDIFYPFSYDENDSEFRKIDAEISMKEEWNPLEKGFQNEILEEIRIYGDQIDRDIFCLLMNGCTEASEISRRLKISEKAVGKRLLKYRNRLKNIF